MRQKLKPDLDLEFIQYDLIETICNSYKPGVSLRTMAKKFELSAMKVRKILITGGVYSTELSTEIDALWRDGKTASEISVLLGTTVANVNSYLPYGRIIYNMEERSIDADRQARYRKRKRGILPPVPKKETVVIERVRDKTMVIVIGRKLRKFIPAGAFDDTTDPLAREGATWMSDGVWHEPDDPDKMIWCAEITSTGRGKNKKAGIVMESACSGFAVISPLPEAPYIVADKELEEMNREARKQAEKENEKRISEYRTVLEKTLIDSIRNGLLSFSLPKERVLDYADTIGRVEIVKGRTSTPQARLEELIERELKWKDGDDPVVQFNVRGNWTTRKFGYSAFYRHVDIAVRRMLKMKEEENEKWLDDFLAPVGEKMMFVFKDGSEAEDEII